MFGRRYSRSDVEKAREIRLWITKIIVPFGAMLYLSPELRSWFKELVISAKYKIEEKYYKLKNKFQNR